MTLLNIDAVNILVLQIRKLKFREISLLAQGHIVSNSALNCCAMLALEMFEESL